MAKYKPMNTKQKALLLKSLKHKLKQAEIQAKNKPITRSFEEVREQLISTRFGAKGSIKRLIFNIKCWASITFYKIRSTLSRDAGVYYCGGCGQPITKKGAPTCGGKKCAGTDCINIY